MDLVLSLDPGSAADFTVVAVREGSKLRMLRVVGVTPDGDQLSLKVITHAPQMAALYRQLGELLEPPPKRKGPRARRAQGPQGV